MSSEEQKMVSRGYLKLKKALKDFSVIPQGKTCIDIGASTGGFVQCLLEGGAKRVYAVDVGKGLLHETLRSDRRVVTLEGINARYLKLNDIGERVDIATVDVSFISCLLVLPPLLEILKDDGKVIVLIKPNFELPKKLRGKLRGGVIRDKSLHIETLWRVLDSAQKIGFALRGLTHSSPPGADGNLEFFAMFDLGEKQQKGLKIREKIVKVVNEGWKTIKAEKL